MADLIQFRRRVLSGSPSSLEEGEPGMGYGDDVLYMGAPGGLVIPIGGRGYFAVKHNPVVTGLLSTPDLKITGGGTPATGKVWTGTDNLGNGQWAVPEEVVTDHGDLDNVGTNTHSQIDTHLASTSNPHSVTKTQVSLGNADNTADADKPVSTLQAAAIALKGAITGQTWTGAHNFPTQSPGNDTTLAATTAFVMAAIAALIDSSPALLNTFNEIAAAIGDDPNFSATIMTLLGEKLVKASNLSDLTNTATARTNLGLGTMAVQNKTAVDITGGTIDNVTITNSTIDGGSF